MTTTNSTAPFRVPAPFWYNPGMSSTRALNIALRTAHIATMGILLGGHAFNVPREKLLPSLWLTIATGVALAVVEAGPSLVWFHQLRGLMTLAKLGLLCIIPLCWNYRLAVLLAIVVLASVGSHMPARFRYYSVVRREVIRDGCGPGASRLNDEFVEEE